MKSFKREPELTADGTYTLYIPEIDEHYHSVNGAGIEASHVYIREALQHRGAERVEVLEVGFGTGLNAFLTLLEHIRSGCEIRYTTLELYPLPMEQIRQLNYGATLAPEHAALYIALHEAPWDVPTEIVPGVVWEKKIVDLTKDELLETYDVVS